MGRHSKKRRYIRRTAAFKKSLVWGILIAAAVPGVLSTAVLYDHVRQSWDGLAADTAVLSAMYTVPDRAFEQLRERFAQPSDPQQPEQEQEKAQQPLIPPQRQEEQPPPTKTQPPPEPVEIPEEYRGTVVEEDLAAAGSSLCFGSGRIKNATSLSEQQVEEYLAQPQPFLLDRQGPQVLIMHTHATESFEPYDSEIYDTRHTWRSTDNSENIVAAGEVMAQAIRSHGIEVLHDDTQHDYPSYNGSYERSAETVKEYLAKYPSIKVVLDASGCGTAGQHAGQARYTDQRQKSGADDDYCRLRRRNDGDAKLGKKSALCRRHSGCHRKPLAGIDQTDFFLLPKIQPGFDHRLAAAGAGFTRKHIGTGADHRAAGRGCHRKLSGAGMYGRIGKINPVPERD